MYTVIVVACSLKTRYTFEDIDDLLNTSNVAVVGTLNVASVPGFSFMQYGCGAEKHS